MELKMPIFSARQQDTSTLVMRSDFGLVIEKPKKTRFEKLAITIARTQNN